MRNSKYFNNITLFNHFVQQSKQEQRKNPNASKVSINVAPYDQDAISTAYDIATQFQFYTFTKNSQNEVAPELIKNMNHLRSLLHQTAVFAIAPKSQTAKEFIAKNEVFQGAILEYVFSPTRTEVNMNQQIKAYEFIKNNQFITFDTEILGGKNYKGAQTFVAMTELAYTEGSSYQNFDDALESTKQYLFGIDEDAYTWIKNLIDNDKFYTKNNELYKVIHDRLAIYGHKNTTINSNTDFSLAKLPVGYRASKEELLNGLENLFEAHKRDASTSNGGLTDGQKHLLNFLQLATDPQMGAFGFNNARSDNLWVNNFISSLDKKTQNIIFSQINMKQFNPYDLRTVIHNASQKMGKQTFFKDAPYSTQKGTYSQEGLIERFFGDLLGGKTSHTGSIDSAALAMLSKHESVAYAYSSMPLTQGSTINYNKQLFYNPYTRSNDASSPLDMLVLPNEIRLAQGFTLEGEEMFEDSFRQKTMDKGGLYTLNSSGAINLNNGDKKRIGKINSNYALDTLYYAQFTPYYADESVVPQHGHSTSMVFFKSQEEMQAYINNMVMVGERDNAGAAFRPLENAPEQLQNRINQLFTETNLKTNETRTLNLDEFITKRNERMAFEKGQSYVTNYEFSKVKKLQALYNGILTELETRGQYGVNSDTRFGISNAQKLSVHLSKGKKITLDMGLDTIGELIGFEDKSYSDTVKRVYSNTINNTLGALPFYNSNSEFLDTVIDFIDANYAKESSYKKDQVYKHIMRSVEATYLDTIKGSSLDTGLELSHNELNYIEIDPLKLESTQINKYGRSINAIQDHKSRVIRIDLNNINSDYDLINKLLEEKLGPVAKVRKGKTDYQAQAKTVLVDFARIYDLDLPKNYLADDITANYLLDQIKEKKQQNITYGIINQNVFSEVGKGKISFGELFDNNPKTIDKYLENILKNIPDVYELHSRDEGAITNLAKRMSHTFNAPINASEYFKGFSFDKDQVRYLETLFNKTNSSIENYYKRILSEFSKIDGFTVGINEHTKSIVAMYQNEIFDIESYLPKLKVHGSNIYYTLGRNTMALRGSITGDQGQFDLSSINVTSNLSKVLDNNQLDYKIKASVRRVNSKIRTPFGALAQLFGSVNSDLREASDVSEMNLMNMRTNFDVDVTYVESLIPEMVRQNLLEVSAEEREIIERHAQRQGTRLIDREGTNADYRKIIVRLRDQAMAKIATPLNPLLSYIAKNNTSFGPEKVMYQGHVNVFPNHAPFMDAEEGSRIVGFQNNFFSFRKDVAQRNVSKLYRNNAVNDRPIVAPGISTPHGLLYGEKALSKFKNLDAHLSNQIVINKLTTSNTMFENIINEFMQVKSYQDNVPKGRNIDALLDVISGVSLLEDSSIIDPRLFDGVFTHQKVQQIDYSPGHFNFDSINNNYHKDVFDIITPKIIDDGKGHYSIQQDGIAVKRNDLLGFSIKGYQDEPYSEIAHYNGTLKIGFKNDFGEMFTQSEINSYLSEAKTKNEATKMLAKLKQVIYVEREKQETYRKMVYNHFEKTKAKAPIVGLGAYDTDLANQLLSRANALDGGHNGKHTKHVNSFLGESKTLQEIAGMIRSLGFSKEEENALYQRAETERYAAWDLIKHMLGQNNIHSIVSENATKHGGVSYKLQELMLMMQQHHVAALRNNGEAVLDYSKVAQIVADDVSSIKGFESAKVIDGVLVFDSASKEGSYDITSLVKVIEEKYGDSIEVVRGNKNTLKHTDFVGKRAYKDGKMIGSVAQTIVSETNEYNMITAAMPLNYAPQIKKHDQEIDDLVSSRKDALGSLTQTKKELSEALKTIKKENSSAIKERNKIAQEIKKVHDAIDANKATQAHIRSTKQNKATVKDFRESKKALKEQYAERKSLSKKGWTKEQKQEHRKILENIEKQIAEIDMKISNTFSSFTQNKKEQLEALKASKQVLIEKSRKLKDKLSLVTTVPKETQDELIKEINETIQEINTIKTHYRNEIQKMQARKSEHIAAFKKKNKGAIYSEREFYALRQMTYDKQYIDKVIDNNTRHYSSELLEQLEINNLDEIRKLHPNKPILSTQIENIITELSAQTNYEKLTPDNVSAVIKRQFQDPYIQEHLINMYHKEKATNSLINPTVEMLETRYTLEQMMIAKKFNDEKAYTKDDLLERGYHMIDINDYIGSYYNDADIIKNGNSVYGKNLLIQIGDEVVAVPRIPTSVYSNDIVNKDYAAPIIRARTAYEEILEAGDADPSMKNYYSGVLSESIQEIKKQVNTLSGKESVLYENMHFRANQSASIKTTTYNKSFAGLKKAMYNGRSIAEWHENNVMISASFLSKQAFEGMGFYEDEFKKTLVGKQFGEEILSDIDMITNDKVSEILSTYGVDAYATRFPVIQPGSMTTTKLYLDTEETGNIAKVLHAEQKRKAGDNDGDDYSFYISHYKNSDGTYVSNLGLNTALEDSQRLGFKHMLGIDATTSNRYVQKLLDDGTLKEMDKIINQNVLSAAGKRLFGDEVIGEQFTNPYMSYSDEERLAHVKNLNHLSSEFYDANNKALDLSNLDEVSSYIDSLSDEDIKKGYRDAVMYNVSKKSRDLSATSRILKTSIGEVNLPLYELRLQSELLKTSNYINQDDLNNINELLYSLEQVPISAKNDTNLNNSATITELKNIMNHAYSGSDVDGKTAINAMSDYLDRTVKEEFITKYAGKDNKSVHAEYTNLSPIEIYERSKQSLLTAMEYLKDPKMSNTRDYIRQMTRLNSTAEYATTLGAAQGVLDYNDFMSAKNLIYNMQGPFEVSEFSTIDAERLNLHVNKTLDDLSIKNITDRALIANATYATQNASQEKIMQSLVDSPKTFGAGFAIGMLGFAASYMLVGAFGNDVTANNIVNAKQQETSMSPQQAQNMLSDYSSNYTYQQAPNNGYVINLSGTMPYDKTQEIAQQLSQSINQAIGISTQMTININEELLSQNDINHAIERSFYL